MTERQRLEEFERAVLPHFNAAYNLARWLTRNDSDAEDVVQEACLRAYRYFDGFSGDSGKAWLLSIVRHTCFTWLAKNRPGELVPLDEATEEAVDRRRAARRRRPSAPGLAADERAFSTD